MSIGKLLAKFAKSLNSSGALPGAHELGDLKWSARSTPSAGWLACDGAAVSRTTYAALFAAIGTAYGAGDGSTTFNVPDYRGRAPVGVGTAVLSELIPNNAVTVASDSIAVAANNDKWITGTPVQVAPVAGGSLPAPLLAGSSYAVIRNGNASIKLAANPTAAVAGTAIDLTSQGAVGFTITAVGAFNARARGDIGGEDKHYSTITEMANHLHALSYSNATAVNNAGDAFVRGAATGNSASFEQATGGSGPHNNMQPYTVSNVFIYAGP
jgi:microcystin-dependent protein